MSRPVAIVLVVAAATLVMFAVLAFWDINDGLDAERARARAAATQIADFCSWASPESAVTRSRCRVDDLEPVAKAHWLVRLELSPGTQLVRRFSCAVIDLKAFGATNGGRGRVRRNVRTYEGVPRFWTYDLHTLHGVQPASCLTFVATRR